MLDYSTYHFEQFINDFEKIYERAIDLRVTEELWQQARLVARAAERQLEVEVRRVYTNLQYELLKGDSTKARNAVFGLYFSTASVQDFFADKGQDWFHLANDILVSNEVANALGYRDISSIDALTKAYRTASKAVRIIETLAAHP